MTSKDPLPQSRHLATEIPGPLSTAAMQRRKEAVAGGLGTAMPVIVNRAQGAIIEDIDGNRIIDLGAGIGVVNVGNSAPRVVKAVQEAVANFTHTNFTTVPYMGYIEVCEALNRLTPGSFKKKSLLQNSGAEAIENAIKIARHYTKRAAVVVFEHAYHGRTNLTMALTAKNMPYKDGFGPFANEIYRMPMPYSFRYEGDLETIAADSLKAVISKIDKEIGAKNVAAILIEPVVGEGGFIVPPDGFMPGLQKFATENGIVFIADEVQSGFSRTGKMFAVEHEGMEPDMIVSAKGIAGGLPLAAVTARAEIMDSSHIGGLGGTYGGNPVVCAAALAVFETIEEEKLVERAAHVGKILVDVLTALKAQYPIIGEVRGRGAMIAIELVHEGTKTPNPEAMAKVIKYCQGKGVLILTAGTYGNVIRFLPPLVISDELLKDALGVLAEGFASL
jgi:4-aminobutyrate aminotransferase / (S)-3-amino-2-methylpropionate transaminase / 5-aminovalerate transaminase